jgi:hypothetical protein|tara:strand:+ start:2143 stop:2424 length:282 start_codon:yes stop_codon:yes gene_type:complete
MSTSPFVTILELASHLRVSESTLRAWIRTERIPKSLYIHVGKTYRYDLEAITEALRGGKDAKKAPPTATWQEELATIDADEPITVLENLDEDF